MTPGHYALFVLALICGAGTIAMIKSFKVENDDSSRGVDVTVTGYEIEGRAMRCAQRIGIKFELSTIAIKELKRGLMYTHQVWIGDGNPQAVGEEFAKAAVEKLWKMGEIDASVRADSTVVKEMGSIVAESISLEEEGETRPMEERGELQSKG